MQDVQQEQRFGNVASAFGSPRAELPNVRCSRCRASRRDLSILPCLHSFCLKCLDEVSAKGDVPLGHYKCPVCQDGLESYSYSSSFIISNILNVVKEDYENNATEYGPCSGCDEGNRASSRCRDCNELLCDNCVWAHQRVRLTKDHAIVNFTADRQSHMMPGPHNNNGTGAGPVSYCCDRHDREVLRLYCETCSQALCRECTMKEHVGHSFVYLQDAVKAARTDTPTTLADVRSLVGILEEGLERSRLMSERLRVRSQNVAAELRTTVCRHRMALNRRERELLQKLEQIHQAKEQTLKSQREHLSAVLEQLARSVDALQHAQGDLELLRARKDILAQVHDARSARTELAEDDQLVFTAPDGALLAA